MPPQLFKHIAVKGAQAGSVIGAGTAGTSILYNMYKTGKAGPAMDIALTRTGTGFAYGLAAVSVLGAARMMQLDADGIQDRAYRLHYNGPSVPLPLLIPTCALPDTSIRSPHVSHSASRVWLIARVMAAH